MRYEIVSSNQMIELEIAMDKKITEGWKPQGGVAMISANHGNIKYAQAIVKEDE